MLGVPRRQVKARVLLMALAWSSRQVEMTATVTATATPTVTDENYPAYHYPHIQRQHRAPRQNAFFECPLYKSA